MVRTKRIEAATGGPAPGLPINFLLCSPLYRRGLREDTAARRQFLCDAGFFTADYEIPNIPTRVVPQHIAEAAEKAGVKVSWNQLVEDVRQFRSAFLFLTASEAMLKEGLVNNSHHLAVKNLAKDKIRTWQQAATAYGKYQRELEQAAERAKSAAQVAEPTDQQDHPAAAQLPTQSERASEIASRIVVPAGATYRDALTKATSGLIEQLAQAEEARDLAQQGGTSKVVELIQQERAEERESYARRLETSRTELTAEFERANREQERASRLAEELRSYVMKESEYVTALANLQQAQSDLQERANLIASLRESLQLVREENEQLTIEWAQSEEALAEARLGIAAAKTSLDTDIKRALEEIIGFCPDKTKARALVTQLYDELAKAGTEETSNGGSKQAYSKNNWPETCKADGRRIDIPNALRAQIGRLALNKQLVIFRNLGTIVDRGFNFEGLKHVPLKRGAANQKCIRVGDHLLEFTVETDKLHFTKLTSNADFQKRR